MITNHQSIINNHSSTLNNHQVRNEMESLTVSRARLSTAKEDMSEGIAPPTLPGTGARRHCTVDFSFMTLKPRVE